MDVLGDTVFFHPLLIHGSGMNRSQGFRKVRELWQIISRIIGQYRSQAISCHYADSECEYIECDHVQDLISKEVTAVFRRRTGIEDAKFQVNFFLI